MNKSEKIICLLLGVVLAWYIYSEMGKAKAARQTSAVETAETVQPENIAEPPKPQTVEPPVKPVVEAAKPSVPEIIKVIENDLVRVEVTSWGAAVRKVTLKKYAKDCGEVSAENPAVELDFAASPLGMGDKVEAFEVRNVESAAVVFVNAALTRKIRLGTDYRIEFEDTPAAGKSQARSVSLGVMSMGNSKNDLLSVDSWAFDAGKGKEGVIHHGDDDSPLKPYLVGGSVGGCSGSKSAAGMPASETVDFPGRQKWVAAKNRFFVTALAEASAGVTSFGATLTRDVQAANYRPESVAVRAQLGASDGSDRMTFYVGPKQQSLLWELGMKDVMEFGMWRWLCYPLVWVLNLFYSWIPNFGIAIILLTILVRIVFWPLTHKSTVGMKKMQELAPKMKEIQAKFKDNPQRLQQETWALYRAEKVNPMSSCLPMLVQIPVFIALFNVLRSAVELRYAPFLWIADLSEPEGILSAYLPFGGINILPILMAVTTGLQSYFTPSTGDKSQQKMMMIFMPAMMLVMFYSFPSALSLYWFLSNIFSIVQMWLIRRSTAKSTGGAIVPDAVIDPPVTRQMKRHG